MRVDRFLKESLSRYRVGTGYLLGTLLAILARPSYRSLAIGLLIVALGEGIRIWAAGWLTKKEELVCSGPYAYVRNPLYLGSLILGIGFSLAANNSYLLIIFLIFFITIYLGTILLEEENLEKKFGESYLDYKRKVPRLIPRLRPYPSPNRGSFSWKLVVTNEEHRTCLGWIILTGILIFKMYLFK